LFIGGMAPVSFVGVDGASVRLNTFVNPQLWAVRILQENQEPGMLPSRNGVFENNIISVTANPLRTWVNIGPGTKPDSFKFANNWWYQQGAGPRARPDLPAPETDGTYGTDPRLDPAANYKPQAADAKNVGHTAFNP
jgi:hypothetical protein